VLGCALVKTEIKRWPDTECYVRLEDNLKDQDAVIVQTTFPDANIIELFLLQDAVAEFKPASIATVVPYFGYGRQDKKFKEGEAVSARAMANHIGQMTDSVFTIDIHNTAMLSDFAVPVQNLSAMEAIGKFLKGNSVDLVVSPDKGSKDRASVAAKSAGCAWDYLEKTRLDGQTVEMKPKSMDVGGKVVAIVDDIIATGGTIIKASEQLKAQGAKTACDLVVSTDTLERPTSKISAASAVAEALKSR
jgi:ribose-phosphate pyrophosphokinase